MFVGKRAVSKLCRNRSVCEIGKCYDVDLYDAGKELRRVVLESDTDIVLQWVLVPTKEHYLKVPELMKPTPTQRLVPHIAAIELLPL